MIVLLSRSRNLGKSEARNRKECKQWGGWEEDTNRDTDTKKKGMEALEERGR